MNVTEYLKNLLWPVTIFIIISLNFYLDPGDKLWRAIWYISIFNTFLYPFSKKMVEIIALKFTTSDYWHSGIWFDTPAKNPVYAIYYLFCYLIAIPASVIYFIITIIKSKSH